MPPSMFGLSAKPLSGRYLSFAEREEIALLRSSGLLDAGDRSPARAGGIDNLQRAAAQCRHPKRRPGYRATTAQWHAERAARRPKAAKLARQRGATNLCGGTAGWTVVAPSGTFVLRSRGVLERPSAWTTEGCGGGQTLGAQSRSPADFRSTSRTMRPCASAMKRSIKRCSFKVEARCGAN